MPPQRPPSTSSPRPSLLPSPFTHRDEQVDNSTFQLPLPPDATSASIYSPDARAVDKEDEDNDDSYPELEAEGDGSLLPPPDFQPFFTLITDAETGETYHPRTSYIFSDDEPDVLTTAALHALDSYILQPAENAESSSERYVIVDLAPSGTEIVSATSLSPAWAITGKEIRGAPSFQDEENTGEGLMLVLEGIGTDAPSLPSIRREDSGEARKDRARGLMEEARKKGGGSLVQGMEELRTGMSGGLGILEKIVGVE